jgi:hypothetical protein
MKTEQTQQHGEAALIAELQKKLNDCLDEGKFIKHPSLYCRLYNVVAGVFMPIDDTDSSSAANWELWFNFRQEIFNTPDCSDLFTSKPFLKVIASMNIFIDDLGRSAKDKFPVFSSSAENLLSSPNPEGWELALSALDSLEEHLSKYDIQNLRFSIQIIKKCAAIAEAADRTIEKTPY